VHMDRDGSSEDTSGCGGTRSQASGALRDGRARAYAQSLELYTTRWRSSSANGQSGRIERQSAPGKLLDGLLERNPGEDAVGWS